jgi:hypothetical protein
MPSTWSNAAPSPPSNQPFVAQNLRGYVNTSHDLKSPTPPASPVHEELTKAGWRYIHGTERHLHFDAVVPDAQLHLGEYFSVIRGHGTASEIMVCPWPPEQDAERLAETIERVEREALRLAGAV